jgi:hypothetical protein
MLTRRSYNTILKDNLKSNNLTIYSECMIYLFDHESIITRTMSSLIGRYIHANTPYYQSNALFLDVLFSEVMPFWLGLHMTVGL